MRHHADAASLGAQDHGRGAVSEDRIRHRGPRAVVAEVRRRADLHSDHERPPRGPRTSSCVNSVAGTAVPIARIRASREPVLGGPRRRARQGFHFARRGEGNSLSSRSPPADAATCSSSASSHHGVQARPEMVVKRAPAKKPRVALTFEQRPNANGDAGTHFSSCALLLGRTTQRRRHVAVAGDTVLLSKAHLA